MKKIALSVIFAMLILLVCAQQSHTNAIQNTEPNEYTLVETHSASNRDWISIGSGTSTQRQPFGMYFGYERSAAIYTASELGSSGLITDLGWYRSTTGTNSCANVKIYLKMTSSSSLSSSTWASMISGATTVLNGSPTNFTVDGWGSFNTTDFTYSNSQNLLVLIETNYGGSGTSTYPLFRYTSSTSRHQYWASDGSAPTGSGTVNNQRPNIMINITPYYPDLTLDNCSITPTSVAAGGTFSYLYRLRNIGNGNAGSFITRFYLSNDQTFGDTDDFNLGYTNEDPLNANTNINRTITNITVPTGTSAGTWYIYVYIDQTDVVDESNENNNLGGPTPSITVTAPPNPPTANTATNITQTSFHANWNSVTGATSYRLDVSTSNSFSSYVSGYQDYNAGNNTSKNVTSLSSGTTYYYRVRAVNTSGTSGNSNVINTKTIPPNPVATDATNITTTSFRANWNASTGASEYRLDISTSNIFSSYVGYDLPFDGLYATYGSASPGITYYYRVRAVNTSGTSGNSNTKSVTTLALPDLTLDNCNVTATIVAPGGTFSYSYRLRNIGNGNAGSFITRFYLSNDQTYGDADDINLGFTNEDPLNSNTNVNRTINNLTVPTGTAAGTWYIYVYVDQTDVVDETNEGNNLAGPTPSITVLPSLSISPTTISVQASSGSFTITVTTNTSWTVSDNATWISTTTSGNVITVTYTQNTSSSPRSGVVTVSAGGLTATCTVTQAGAPSITVTQPVGGETWYVGSTHNITWTSTGSTANVNIFLCRNGSTILPFIAINTANDGLFQWYIDNLDIVTDVTYTIIVNDANGVFDESVPFTIIKPGVDVLAPIGGETWAMGTTQNINWDPAYLSGNVRIELWNGNNMVGAPIATVPFNSMPYSWLIPTNLTAGNQYRIKIITLFVANDLIYDFSDYFTISVSGSSTPIANATDISQQPEFIYPNTPVPYEVKAKYFDPNGRADLRYAYLKIDHPDPTATDFTMIKNTVSGEITTDPPNALSVNSATSIDINENGFQGYELTWRFSIINWGWPAAQSGINFAVKAVDSSGTQSTWSTDNSNCNFKQYGITFISHGWCDPVSNTAPIYGDSLWMMSMAEAIKTRIGDHAVIGVYDKETGSYMIPNPNPTPINPLTPIYAAGENELILLFDWADDSNNWVTGFSQAASDAAFASIMQYRDLSNANYLHLIGHSRGTVIVSEIAERLIQHNVPVDQVTYIDTHDWGVQGVICDDFDVNWGLEIPSLPESPIQNISNSGAVGWEQIGFIDTYYQTNPIPLVGRPVLGTFNLLLTNTSHTSIPGLYTSTISNSFSTWGFRYSRIGNVKSETRPSMNGFQVIAPYDYSINNSGIFNGDFSLESSYPIYPAVPGWSFHNGVSNSGNETIDGHTILGGNGFLSAKHNRFYIPEQGVDNIYFKYRTSLCLPGTNDILRVYLNEDINNGNSWSITQVMSSWSEGTYITIPNGLKGSVCTLTIELVDPSRDGNRTITSIVWIDDVQFIYIPVPVTPTNLLVTFNGTLTPLMSWSPYQIVGGTDQAGYQIRVRNHFTDEIVYDTGFISAASGSSHTYSPGAYAGTDPVTGMERISNSLVEGVEYHWHIRYKSIGGEWSLWANDTADNYAIFTAPILLLQPPIAIVASNITQTSFLANWNAASGATGYKIDVSLNSGFSSFVAGYNSLTVSGTSQSVMGLSGGTTYYYRVRATNTSGTSSSSNTITVLTVPSNPVAITATIITATSFQANWNASIGATNYKFDVSINHSFSSFVTGYNDIPVTTTNRSVTGLSAGTTYYYRVRAVNSNGTSGNSNVIGTITIQTIPTTPSGLTATAQSTNQIYLSWTDNSNNEEEFKIERKTGIGGTWAQIDAINSNTTIYQNTGLNPNTTYYYRVRAYNSGGNSDYSNEAHDTTLQNVTTPTSPSILIASPQSATQINLAWTDNSNNEDGFYLERKTGVGGTWSQISIVNANLTSYFDTGLSGSTTYYYRIRAYNTAGNSAYSSEANATTPEITLDLQIVKISYNQLRLSWNAMPGAISYKIYGAQIPQPIGSNQWTEIAEVTDLYYLITPSASCGYYYITYTFSTGYETCDFPSLLLGEWYDDNSNGWNCSIRNIPPIRIRTGNIYYWVQSTHYNGSRYRIFTLRDATLEENTFFFENVANTTMSFNRTVGNVWEPIGIFYGHHKN